MRKHLLMTALLAAIVACKRSPPADPGVPLATCEAKSAEAFAVPESFQCSCDGDAVSVRGGRATWSSRRGPIEVPLSPDGIEGVLCGRLGDDLALVFQALAFDKEGDFHYAKLVRVSSETKQIRYELKVQANTGPALKRRNTVYVSGSGFLAKVDADAGRFVWKHEGLGGNSPGPYVYFGAPRIERSRVIFPTAERMADDKRKQPWPEAVVVDDASGKILDGAPPSR